MLTAARFASLLTACLTFAHTLPASAAESQIDGSKSVALPRYSLKVGQELVYRLTKHQEYEGGKPEKPDDTPRDDFEWRSSCWIQRGKPHAVQLGYSADLPPRLRAMIRELQNN